MQAQVRRPVILALICSLALAGLLPARPAAAASFSLVAAASPAQSVRASGRTERLSDLTLTISGLGAPVAINATVRVALQSNTGGTILDDVAVAADAGAPFVSVSGTGLTVGAPAFDGATAFTFSVTGTADDNDTIKITNLRADIAGSSLGSAGGVTGFVQAVISATDPGNTITVSPDTLRVSNPVQPGLAVAVADNLALAANQKTSFRFSGDGLLPEPATDTSNRAVVHLREPFASAWTTLAQEQGSPVDSRVDNGTQIEVLVRNIPQDVHVGVPSKITSGTLELRIATANVFISPADFSDTSFVYDVTAASATAVESVSVPLSFFWDADPLNGVPRVDPTTCTLNPEILNSTCIYAQARLAPTDGTSVVRFSDSFLPADPPDPQVEASLLAATISVPRLSITDQNNAVVVDENGNINGVDFGLLSSTLGVGVTYTDRLTITNTGGVDLKIYRYQATPASVFKAIGASPTLIIPAGGTATIDVSMTAKAVGAQNGILSIVTNEFDPLSNSFTRTYNIPLHADFVGAGQLQVGVKRLSVPTVPPGGRSSTGDQVIENIGDYDLQVNVVTLRNNPTPSVFSLQTSKPIPAVLKPGEKMTFRLEFAPTQPTRPRIAGYVSIESSGGRALIPVQLVLRR